MDAFGPTLRRYTLLVLVPLIFCGAAQAKVVVPLKSETDTREFRHIELDNGLQVLLIEDEDEPDAAVAVSVRAGAYHDPDDWPGLAHLLLHNILLGNMPEEHEDKAENESLRDWLQGHGGAARPHIL